MKRFSCMKLNRHRFLCGAGTLLALPRVNVPRRLAAATPSQRPQRPQRPQRLVCVAVHLSLYPGDWFPTTTGPDYELPSLLQPIAHLRKQFTLISGMDHPNVARGHDGEPAFLSGLNRTETLDQRVARELAQDTRFGSLQLASSSYQGASATSWNRNGLPLMGEGRVDRIFEQLFVDPQSVAEAEAALARGNSVLDAVREDAKAVRRMWSGEDKHRLDALLDAVREIEQKVAREREWVREPKPSVEAFEGTPKTYHENLERVFDLAALALQTDSSRIITIRLNGGGLPIEINGKSYGSDYHGLSHHGKDPSTIADLLKVEQAHMTAFSRFLDRLAAIPDGNGTLLDHTQVLFGSGLGNGSSHSTYHLPVLLAGGGFRHGQHVALQRRTPLCDLYVTMLQKMGLEIEQVGSSRSNVNEVFA